MGSFIASMGLIVSSLGIFIANKTGDNLLNLTAEDTTYSLTLNSSNSVSSAGDYVQHTAHGGEVTFTYASVSTPTGNYHTTILNGGSIVNKDVIHSISKFNAVFEGQLQARISYLSNKNWGGYFDLVSGQTIDLGSHPYYLELKATSNVTLESATYTYTCKVNPDAAVVDTEGSYDITFKQNGGSSDGSTELTSSTIGNQITSGSSYITSYSTLSKVYSGRTGLKLGSGSNNGILKVGMSFGEEISSIQFTTAKYGDENTTYYIYLNNSDDEAGSFSAGASSSDATIAVNGAITSLEIVSQRRSYLQGITFNYGSHIEPSVPDPVEVGFEASDANRMDYTTNSVFATDNALSVKSINSNGQKTSLTTGYTYKIYNSLDAVIDVNEKFPSAGTYRLVVSYKNYIPQEIELVVGVYVYPVDLTITMADVDFNTADVLGNNLTDNLSILVNMSDGSNKPISYANFGADFSLTLLTPKGFTYSINDIFGSEGSWTLKVTSNLNEEVEDAVNLTVSAIPVTNVSLDQAELNLQVGKTGQLTATITPNNATNKSCNWSSNNDEVAVVDNNGLVTAVGVGQATITATSLDGTNKYGTCLVKVTEAAASSDVGTFELISSSELEIGQYVLFVGSNSGSYYAMNTQSSNNRATNSVTVTSNKIERTASSSFRAFKVKAGVSSGTFSFYDETDNGYLYAASSSKNYLRTQSTLDANGSFTSSLAASGSSSNKYIRFNYNNGTPIFSCYGSSTTQLAVSIYANTSGSGSTPTPTNVYPTSIDVTGNSSIAKGETSQLSVTFTPSDTTIKDVTYSSSNTAVATVSNTGLVTGVSAGTAVITASAATATGSVTDTITITVSNIAVTGVSLDPTSISVAAGKTATITATVLPANVYNKNVIFASSNTGVATVTNAGVVTGIAAGKATITATTQDGGKTATCAVTVTSSSASTGFFTIKTSDVTSTYSSGSTITVDGFNFNCTNVGNTYTSGAMQWKKSSAGYIYNTDPIDGLNDISIASISGKTFGLTITSGTSSNPSGNSQTLTNSNSTYSFPAGMSYFKLTCNSTTSYTGDITISYSTEPIDPTAISVSPTSIEASAGQSKTLEVTYTPSNANQNKAVSWTSSNTNVATVDTNGKVTIADGATVGQTATITARLTNLTSIYATASVKVVEVAADAWTIMIYMCGADLESKNGLASGDIDEILKVSGQPDDVNIIIETGGASKWESGHSYSIANDKLERWHVANKKLVKDASLSYASMGLTSTFQSFLEWGLTSYPADKTGVIMWNHGGGMRGVCYDEKKNDDCLLNSEVKTAVANAKQSCKITDNLEWIGYDACLMSVQDIAEFNSAYFNYQISSEESEAGYGWDYDNWVDDLYKKVSTPNLLKAIVDSFISDNGGATSNGDQTLSYLDLAYASAYKSAWEAMAQQLSSKVTSSNKGTFNTAIINNVKHYADNDYDYFCTFDAKDFVDKLANNSAFSSFRIDSSYTTAVMNAHANFVAYNVAQKGAGKSYGICMYWPNNSQYSDVSTYYTTSQTNFTNWRSLCVNRGTHA